MQTSVAPEADAATDATLAYLEGTWRGSNGSTASYRLPTQRACEIAAALSDRVLTREDPRSGGRRRRWAMAVSPGVLRIRSSFRGVENADGGWCIDWDEAEVVELLDGRRELAEPTRDQRQRMTREILGNNATGTRSVISEWSRKSRLNMARTLAALDWSAHLEQAPAGWRPQMLTLTLPGDWESIAPDGATFKRLFHAWLKRWRRRWGHAWAGTWKLEFQGRGAPHLHLYGVAPVGVAFQEWLSWSWFSTCAPNLRDDPGADVQVAHYRAGTGVDWREGVRATDPRTVALYFLGRSVGHNFGLGKEYQHRVPEAWRAPGKGPGRFWGHRGLRRCEVVRELDARTFIRLRRLVRRWSKANGRRISAASWSRWQGYSLLHGDVPAWLSQALRWDGLRRIDEAPRGVCPYTGEILRRAGPVGVLP